MSKGSGSNGGPPRRTSPAIHNGSGNSNSINNMTTPTARKRRIATGNGAAPAGGRGEGDGGNAPSSSSFAQLFADLSSSSARQPPPSPLVARYYYSRRQSSRLPSLSTADDFVGISSPWAWLWGFVFFTVPLCYVYVGLVLLRELCLAFPETVHEPIKTYLPRTLASLVEWMRQSYKIVECWCWIEGAFYICMKLRIRYLQTRDPLEASLSSAPLMETSDRQKLWERMVECESEDPVGWLSGWFFDVDVVGNEKRKIEEEGEKRRERTKRRNDGTGTNTNDDGTENNSSATQNGGDHRNGTDAGDDDEGGEAEAEEAEESSSGSVVSKYDVRDFLCWSMFETRHQEHLTTAELRQLESFVDDLEYRISLQLYGEKSEPGAASESAGAEDDDEVCGEENNGTACSTEENGSPGEALEKERLPAPKKRFRFSEETNADQPSHLFFVELYESYKNRYEEMMKNAPQFHPVQDLKDMVKNAAPDMNMPNFHPVQELKNFVSGTAQTISQAEESACAAASQVYGSLVPTGSEMDKRLTAVSHATYQQLADAWDSVKNMKDRLETARFLSKQRQRIRQQLKGYRVMLNRMREMSSAVSAKQMAAMMRRITECNQSLELLENRAQNAFVQATGYARKNLPFFGPKEPQHYARYSTDPLLGIATYPLGFHLLILGCTEIPLRVLLGRRGFERRTIGSVAYYVHPGRASYDDENDSHSDSGSSDGGGDEDSAMTPIVFVHGIGIGLIAYLPLIDKLLETERPILLPEIPYVSAFRPWQSPSDVLSPATVASTMTAMLASHGYLTGTWVGHSYGTSWLSYMCQFAPNAVSAIVFLDPICFCLHVPRLTKQFVYQRPDPGTASYLVRTDLVVNWTIQRAFPWTSIVLFVEQVPVPCSVFLSDRDALVPAVKIESYLRKSGAPVRDFDRVRTGGEGGGSSSNGADACSSHFGGSRLNVTVMRGDGHGDWVDRPSVTVPTIASAVEILCQKAEAERHSEKRE